MLPSLVRSEDRCGLLRIRVAARGAVIAMNRTAMAALDVERELVLVPRGTHLFEEAGTLETVADLACEWFGRHLWLSPGSARPRAAEAKSRFTPTS